MLLLWSLVPIESFPLPLPKPSSRAGEVLFAGRDVLDVEVLMKVSPTPSLPNRLLPRHIMIVFYPV